MTLQSELDQITNAARDLATNTAETFLASSGKIGISSFFRSEAGKGKRLTNLHISNGKNPSTLKSGFTTLSGELAIINSPSSPGVQTRNGICWVYLNMTPRSTIADFNTAVTALVTDLTVTDGLTVTINIGATMADLVVGW